MNHSPFSMPAEWEPHHSTWLAWPHNRKDWPGKLQSIQWAYTEIVRTLAPGETIHLIVDSANRERQARSMLARAHAQMEQVVFHRWPTNRGWTRDFGPLFVLNAAQEKVVLDFGFNGWAKYPDWQLDTAIPQKAAQAIHVPVIDPVHRGRHVILEGGGIDVNGVGTLLATEECWLDIDRQVRNPGFTRADYEAVFRHYLGATQTIWLGAGIAGDDTHGHVDDLCRFVNPNTVVLAHESDPADANYQPLNENHERLQGARLANGEKLEVIDLPMPAPLWHDGRRLPASYANFYIANAAVLVPTFNDVNDRLALGILADCFPDRDVIGIHAVDLVWGLGTLHCLTQQEP